MKRASGRRYLFGTEVLGFLWRVASRPGKYPPGTEPTGETFRYSGAHAATHRRRRWLTTRSLRKLNDYDGGVDLKYSLTSALTLDATYRTDFAQVEADQQQVNLTRFSLFFPEKRNFFLENSGTFGFGPGGNLVPFFSRRIGLNAAGNQVPIIGGARVSGKSRSI